MCIRDRCADGIRPFKRLFLFYGGKPPGVGYSFGKAGKHLQRRPDTASGYLDVYKRQGLDWNKFGKVISMALLAAGGFYMICIYSFGTIIPWTDFIKSTVPALACLKNINMFLYVAMLIIATLGPMGPMNSFYGATSRIMLAMGRKGQLPDSFAVLDEKSGAPKMANTVLAVLTIMGPFLGKNMLVSLTNVSALAFIFSCTMVSFACLKMRYTEPDLPRPCLLYTSRCV